MDELEKINNELLNLERMKRECEYIIFHLDILINNLNCEKSKLRGANI